MANAVNIELYLLPCCFDNKSGADCCPLLFTDPRNFAFTRSSCTSLPGRVSCRRCFSCWVSCCTWGCRRNTEKPCWLPLFSWAPSHCLMFVILWFLWLVKKKCSLVFSLSHGTRNVLCASLVFKKELVRWWLDEAEKQYDWVLLWHVAVKSPVRRLRGAVLLHKWPGRVLLCAPLQLLAWLSSLMPESVLAQLQPDTWAHTSLGWEHGERAHGLTANHERS